MPPLTNREKQRRRRERLNEVAHEYGYSSAAAMLTALMNGEARLTPVNVEAKTAVTELVAGLRDMPVLGDTRRYQIALDAVVDLIEQI